MTITKIVTWTTAQGKNIEAKIERTIDICDNIAYADGWNVNLGKETIDLTTIKIYADGKCITSGKLSIISKEFYRNYEELKAKGVYAKVGDAYIGKAHYDLIMAAIAEAEAEIAQNNELTEKFKEVRAQEIAKEEREIEEYNKSYKAYKAELKRGLCPKCGTYCYGDCQA